MRSSSELHRDPTLRSRRSTWSRDELRELGGDQLLEPLCVVERADQGESEVLAQDVGGDTLDVLDGHGVQAREHLLRLDRRALEELAAEAEHDRRVRALEPEDEAALRERARLLELLEGAAVEPEEVLAGLDAVTVEDVQRVAADILGKDLRLALIGPFDDAERFEKLIAA